MRRTQGGRLGMVALGALGLSCAGMRLPSLPSSPEDVVQLGVNAIDAGVEASQCEQLRSKASVQEEYALGGAVALRWVEGGRGLLLAGAPEQQLQRQLNVIGRNLAAQSTRPTLQWTFGVLRDAKAVNATSSPGGYVFITRGLLAQVENEAQLAGVLAHEIAHVTLQHALKRYDDVKVSQCTVAVAGESARKSAEQLGAKWTPDLLDPLIDALQNNGVLDLDRNLELLGAFADELVEKIVTDGFAEDDEHAADAEAVRLLLSAGYDAEEYLRLLGKLDTASKSKGFAHHPSASERQQKLRAQLDKHRKASQGEQFSDTPTEGLRKPPLPPAFSIVRAGR